MFSLFQDPIYKAAEEANKYARSQIIIGSTFLDKKKLNPEEINGLEKAVEGDSSNPDWLSVRDVINLEFERRIKLGESAILASYRSIISVTSKFSLGNCNELAIQALDYILNNAPNINAEVYKFDNGDHAFLVLNRDPDSTMNDTTTWGNAVICDPWAGKVYYAKDCFTQLENFYRDNTSKIDKLELYDPNKHLLLPSEYFNTATLRNEILKDKIRLDQGKEIKRNPF